MTRPADVAVGFAGLGRMGAPMAGRLLEAGFPLVVWNRTPQRTAQLAAGGARVVQHPRELAEAASIVVTMLADADALGVVLDGEDGLIAGLSPDSILIDMSTIGPKAARRFAAATAERGAHWIDAPVSGSTALAESGGLAIMLGGDREVVARAEPVLEVLGAKRFHLGGAGAGAAMKLAVNAVIAVLNEALAEGLVLAERAGIAREDAYEVFASGAVAAPYVLYKQDAFLRPDEAAVAFTVELMQKDLRLVLALADELGIDPIAVRAADDTLARASELGMAERDFSSVAELLRTA